jgi:hypothetical protein
MAHGTLTSCGYRMDLSKLEQLLYMLTLSVHAGVPATTSDLER